MIQKCLYPLRVTWYGCVFLGTLVAPSVKADQSFFDLIEAAVLADAEVVARKAHLEALTESGPQSGLGAKPELRVKLEKESLSADTVLGTAIRWNLDPSNPKWLRAQEHERDLAIAESKLRIAMFDTRVRLKRMCARIAYLRESLDLASSDLRQQEEHLNDFEVLFKAGSADRWEHFRAKREHAKVLDEVARLKAELDAEEIELSTLVGRDSLDFDGAFDASWRVADVDSLGDLEANHPQTIILRAKRSFESDRSLAERKNAKGAKLSYVQLQAEQEDAWSRDESDSRLGISFGIEFPWGKKKRLADLEVGAKEDLADYEEELASDRIQLEDTYESFRSVHEKHERMLPIIDGFLEELRLLTESFLGDFNVPERSRLLQIQGERSRLLGERIKLRYEFWEAALDLEFSACREIVF